MLNCPKIERLETGSCGNLIQQESLQFGIKIYGKNRIAIDSFGNYLGRWEYKGNSVLEVTKQPNEGIENLNTETGDCDFVEVESFIEKPIVLYLTIDDKDLLKELEEALEENNNLCQDSKKALE